jgi:hypothetical protein
MCAPKRIRAAKFWDKESSEALSRTLIDIVLFDQMEAHQEEIAARRISVLGEYHVEVQSLIGKEIIVGSVGYVLGYDPTNELDPKYFESTSVIVRPCWSDAGKNIKCK